jgi:hypothetical protein
VIEPDAILWGEKWYEDHYNNKPLHLDNDRFGGYIARKQTHIHKLAMILSVSQRSTLTITQHDLEEANRFISSIEADMPKVFDRIGVGQFARGQSEILSVMQTYKQVLQDELFRMLYRKLSGDEFQAALVSAEQAGYIKRHPAEGSNQLMVTYCGATLI